MYEDICQFLGTLGLNRSKFTTTDLNSGFRGNLSYKSQATIIISYINLVKLHYNIHIECKYSPYFSRPVVAMYLLQVSSTI